jgi:hypothetical protein
MQFVKDQFYNIKQYLHSSNSNVIKKYFSLLGYKYTSSIQNNNFFHFATEAYIISVIKEIKENLKEEEILVKLLSEEVEEDDFLDNLEILIGNTNSSDDQVKISSDKLAQIFLNNIKYEKEENGNDYKDNSLSIDIFFKRIVNYSLNSLNYSEDEKNLDLFNTFDKYKTVEGGLNIEKFVEEFKNKMYQDSKTKTLRQCVQNECEVYFYFAQVSFKDFINDINHFNQQSTSVIYIGIALFKAQLNSQTSKLKNLYDFTSKNVSSIKEDIVSKTELVKSNCLSKLYLVNKFIGEKFNNSKAGLLNNYPAVYDKISQYNQAYLTPIQSRMTVLKDDSYSFLLNSYSKGKNSFEDVKKSIIEKVAETYKVSYEKASNFVHVSVDNLGKIAIVQVCYDKINSSRTIFYSLLESIQSYVKNYNLEQLKVLAKNTYSLGKTKMIDSYEKFLGITVTDKKTEESKEVQKEELTKSS